jgi:hypothetical protein
MWSPRPEVGDASNSTEVCKPNLQPASADCAQSSLRLPLLLTKFAEPLIVEPYFHFRVEGYRRFAGTLTPR